MTKPEEKPNLESEVCTLGSAVLDPSQFDVIRGIVTADDFMDDGHRRLFSLLAMIADSGKPINDMVILSTEAKQTGVFDALGGVAAFAKIFQSVPHAKNAVFYARDVAEKGAKRRQLAIAAELQERASSAEFTAHQNAEWVNAKLGSTLNVSSSTVRSVAAIAQESLTKLQSDMAQSHRPGVMTGMYEFDRIYGSLMCGEMTVLAARPSVGKTALALQIAENAALKGKRSLVVSLEMRDRELVDRMLSKNSGVNGRKIRNRSISDEEFAKLRGTAAAMQDVPLFVWAPPHATFAQIRAVARLEAARGGLDFLTVDYLGMVRSTNKMMQRNEHIGDVSSSLKGLAKELDVPVLVLCQLNREAETSEPNLAMLRDSGAIEQDADVVMFLHKESREADTAKWIVAKFRNGEIGHVWLDWEKTTTRFTSQNIPEEHGVFNDFNARD